MLVGTRTTSKRLFPPRTLSYCFHHNRSCLENVEHFFRFAEAGKRSQQTTSRRVFSTLPANNEEGSENDDIIVTVTKSTDLFSTGTKFASSSPALQSEETALVDSLLSHTATLVDPSSKNIIAYSGGIDSSLVADLVYRTFHQQSKSDNILKVGSVNAVIGISPSLPPNQLQLARSVASHIGIDLTEVKTTEGTDRNYIENTGQACFVCKSHLYSALEAVASTALASQQSSQSVDVSDSSTPAREKESPVILYNGTNSDDTQDPTRLGLLAAKSFSVKSPLLYTTKSDVRRAAKHLNLPNWNYAASPCLRSRLALGVEATSAHLKAVNTAEEKVRKVLGLDATVNMRVRMLSGKRAMVELDKEWFSSGNLRNNEVADGRDTESILREEGMDELCIELGFLGGFGVRAFKSGSVSGTGSLSTEKRLKQPLVA